MTRNQLYILWLEEIADPLWMIGYIQQLWKFGFDFRLEEETGVL